MSERIQCAAEYTRQKYLKRMEKLAADPEAYNKYREGKKLALRKLAEDQDFRLRRAVSCADWRYRKARGLPTRPRVNRMPQTPLRIEKPQERTECVQRNFDFTLVPQISVAFD